MRDSEHAALESMRLHRVRRSWLMRVALASLYLGLLVWTLV